MVTVGKNLRKDITVKQVRFNSNATIFLASICAVFVLAVAPVFAQGGSDGTSGDTSTSSSDDSSMSGSDSSGSKDSENEAEPTETEVEHQASMFRRHGSDRLAELRDGKELKTVAQRQKTCVHIQKAVNHKLKAFNNNANKHLTRLNTVFTRLQAYQTANNLPVSNYDTLVADATAKQAAATLAVQALGSVGTTLDCSTSDPASMLSGAKAAAADTRDALKAYRTSLKNIVVALAQAKGDDNSADTTEGSN